MSTDGIRDIIEGSDVIATACMGRHLRDQQTGDGEQINPDYKAFPPFAPIV
jgi:hypothetical protein